MVFFKRQHKIARIEQNAVGVAFARIPTKDITIYNIYKGLFLTNTNSY